MQTSGLPTRIAVPFADAGTKNTIPVASQIGITGGAASFTTGFPPLTMTPVSAGGIPPFGADFNGILNAITNAIRWNVAGSGYPFDSTFATDVTGYPKGALLPASDFSGYWLNTQEANTTTPENSTSATTGWVPGVHYGTTALTGLSSSSVTLTTLQAAKPRINLSGTLTANINLVFPAWVRSWTVVNNCTGNFSVTCKTPSGTGVAIPTALTAVINGDGVNITQDTNLLGVAGRLLNVQTITSSGTYTPTPGTTSVIVEVQGAGGGGGYARATSTEYMSAGAGGGAGGYGKSRLTSGFSGVAITIGSGGSQGVSGGSTSFGSLIVAAGGGGGLNGTDQYASGSVSQYVGASGGSCTGGNIINSRGGTGGNTIMTTAGNLIGGCGGTSHFTAAAISAFGGNGTGVNGLLGCGGGGAISSSSPSTSYAGGNGGNGLVVIWEYA